MKNKENGNDAGTTKIDYTPKNCWHDGKAKTEQIISILISILTKRNTSVT